MKNINIRVPEELYRLARSEAGGEGLSLTAWVKALIEKHFAAK